MLVSTTSKLMRLLKQLREQISESTDGDTGDKTNLKTSFSLVESGNTALFEGEKGVVLGWCYTEAELWTYSAVSLRCSALIGGLSLFES